MGLRHLEQIRADEPAFDARADVWTFDTGSPPRAGRRPLVPGPQAHRHVQLQRPVCHRLLLGEGPYRELVYGGNFDDLGRVELFPYGFVWMLHRGLTLSPPEQRRLPI